VSLIPDPVVDLFNAVAPDVPLARSFGVHCMMLAIVILCFFPEIATWLPI
jgi:C4-dicarboxylate transporter DctM subunit